MSRLAELASLALARFPLPGNTCCTIRLLAHLVFLRNSGRGRQPTAHRCETSQNMGQPYSNADPDGNLKDKWLDKGWPLTRFLGYRPPPADPVAARHWAAGMDHILPAPLRERHRKRRREEQLRKEGAGGRVGGTPNGQQTAAAAEKGAIKGPSKEEPSLGTRVKHKLWDMWLTLLGCFFGIAFSALSESPQHASSLSFFAPQVALLDRSSPRILLVRPTWQARDLTTCGITTRPSS